MDTITCPHCGKPVELTLALKTQIESETLEKVKIQHQNELESAKKEAIDASIKKTRLEFEFKLKLAQEEAMANEKRNKELAETISSLSEDRRQLKKEKEELKTDMIKKLEQEEEKIRKEAQIKAEEEQHLKLAEKDKQLENALKEVEGMRRKLQQGSQQMQGEVFELEFEAILQKEFPNDKITEVAKGTRGGDIVQEVWDRNGNFCGKILWELKNTKTWSETWIEKLKEDQRNATADYAVIISEAVPNDIVTAKFYKNVWVTKRQFVIGLAYALRLNVIQITMAKRGKEGIKEKKDVMYSYLSSTEFRLRVEAIVEAFTSMQNEIEKERRYFTNKWARDEKNIRQVIDNTTGMYGDLRGIMGSVLPQIKGIELLEDGIDV